MLEWDRPDRRAGVAVHELSPITNTTDDGGFSRWSAFNVVRSTVRYRSRRSHEASSDRLRRRGAVA